MQKKIIVFIITTNIFHLHGMDIQSYPSSQLKKDIKDLQDKKDIKNLEDLNELAKRASEIKITRQKHDPENNMLLIKEFDPALYAFGQQHNLTVQELMDYKRLLKEFTMNPRGVLEFIKHNYQLSDKEIKKWEVDAYAAMQEKEPDKYNTIVLHIIKDACDNQEGKIQSPRPHEIVHFDVLEDKISDQKDDIVARDKIIIGVVIGKIAAIISTVGSLAWAIYNQVEKFNNATH